MKNESKAYPTFPKEFLVYITTNYLLDGESVSVKDISTAMELSETTVRRRITSQHGYIFNYEDPDSPDGLPRIYDAVRIAEGRVPTKDKNYGGQRGWARCTFFGPTREHLRRLLIKVIAIDHLENSR